MTNKRLSFKLKLLGAALLFLALGFSCSVALSQRLQTDSVQSAVAPPTTAASSVRAAAPVDPAMPKGVWRYLGSGRYTFEDGAGTSQVSALPKAVISDGVTYMPVLTNFLDTAYMVELRANGSGSRLELPSAVRDVLVSCGVNASTSLGSFEALFAANFSAAGSELSPYASMSGTVTTSSAGLSIYYDFSGYPPSYFEGKFLLLAIKASSSMPEPLWRLYDVPLNVRAFCANNSEIDAVIRNDVVLETLPLLYIGGGSFGFSFENLKSKVDAVYSDKIAYYSPDLMTFGSFYGGKFFGSDYVSYSSDTFSSLDDILRTVSVNIPTTALDYGSCPAANCVNNPFSTGVTPLVQLTLNYSAPSLKAVYLNYIDVTSGERKDTIIMCQEGVVPDLSAYVVFNDEYRFDCYVVTPVGGTLQYLYTLPPLNGITTVKVSYLSDPIGQYTVAFEYFDYNDFTFKRVTKSLRDGTAVTVPDNVPLSSERYRFQGWKELNIQGAPVLGSGELPAVSRDIVYSAQYDVAPFTVTVSYLHPVSGERVTYSEQIPFNGNLPARPAVRHFRFDGWYTTEDFSDISSNGLTIVRDITLYCRFERDRDSFYPVTWYFNGNRYEQTTCFALDAPVAPAPPDIPDGYVFSHYEQQLNGAFLRIDTLPSTLSGPAVYNLVYVYAQDFYTLSYADREGNPVTKELHQNVGTPFAPVLSDLSPYFTAWTISSKAEGLSTRHTYTASYLVKSVDLIENGVKRTVSVKYTQLSAYGAGPDCTHCTVLGLSRTAYGYYYCFIHENEKLVYDSVVSFISYTGATGLGGDLSQDSSALLLPVVFDYNAACSVRYSVHDLYYLTLDVQIDGKSVEQVKLRSSYDTAYYFEFNLTSWLKAGKYKDPDDIAFPAGYTFENKQINGQQYYYYIRYGEGVAPGNVSAVLSLSYDGNAKGFWAGVGDFFGGIGGAFSNVWDLGQNLGSKAVSLISGLLDTANSALKVDWLFWLVLGLAVVGVVIVAGVVSKKKS